MYLPLRAAQTRLHVPLEEIGLRWYARGTEKGEGGKPDVGQLE